MGVFDEYLQDVKNWWNETTDNVISAVNELRTKAAEMMQMKQWFITHQNTINQHPELQNEYNLLMSMAGEVSAMVNGIMQKIREAGAWFEEQTGLSAYEAMNGLGAVQLIPIAVIVGGTAAITKWLTSAYALKSKIEHIEQMQAEGADPEQLWKTINTPAVTENSLMSSAKTVGWILGLGAFAYLVWPHLPKRLNRD